MLKSLAGFVLMTYRVVVKPLTLRSDNFVNETICIITVILLFISINDTSQHRSFTRHLVLANQSVFKKFIRCE